MTFKEPDTLVLYREVHKVKETCAYGNTHEVTYYTRKVVTLTDETYVCDNGYEKSSQPVYKDAQGRLYFKYVSIDYFNNVWYNREGGGHFVYTPRASLARLVNGTPLNDKTPAGPALQTEQRTVIV